AGADAAMGDVFIERKYFTNALWGMHRAFCVSAGGSFCTRIDGSAGVFHRVGFGDCGAGLAFFFKVFFYRFFSFLLCGLLFLAEGFFDGSVVLFVIELAEIVRFTLHVL